MTNSCDISHGGFGIGISQGQRPSDTPTPNLPSWVSHEFITWQMSCIYSMMFNIFGQGNGEKLMKTSLLFACRWVKYLVKLHHDLHSPWPTYSKSTNQQMSSTNSTLVNILAIFTTPILPFQCTHHGMKCGPLYSVYIAQFQHNKLIHDGVGSWDSLQWNLKEYTINIPKLIT